MDKSCYVVPKGKDEPVFTGPSPIDWSADLARVEAEEDEARAIWNARFEAEQDAKLDASFEKVEKPEDEDDEDDEDWVEVKKNPADARAVLAQLYNREE